MRVLVTGLDGFTGKYLNDQLIAYGHTVIGLQSDLTDQDAVSKEVSSIAPDAVIHLGGISFVAAENINRIYQVNLLGTRNLLVALHQHAPRISCIILASTGNVYGNSKEEVLTEISPIKPTNDYSVSKYSMEQMAALWIDKLPIVIVRPFNYTGVGQAEHFLIPKIVSHFKSRKSSIELGNVDVSREFGDVRAVAEIYCKLLEKKPGCEIFNICTGQAYSLKEVMAMCEKITGHHIDIHVNPLFVRPNEVASLTGSNKRLKQCIGNWAEFSLEDTLQWMLSA